ncbi:radical SAM/SPASM domain-containing protein [Proteiniphilum sp. X52]|uniref:radical SAM/SPASM domain-containing protein n=1 Tax=Proteiniphilum sp. X52 TaxID=2382159 RepID=UPI000F09A8CF|nr:radical SAM protein [Proteiniphilum sp. X52]RNC63427.1 SPASM domain-containing protein [Proteiniphilum sp. X52]
MKKSKYNYIFYDDNYSYWFQGLKKTFFRIERNLGKKLEEVICDPYKISEMKILLPKLYENLKTKGFLIDNSMDEFELIKKKRQESIQSKDYFLIILPTLNCNFKCWYCIQDHIPSVMSESTIQKIKNHIDYKIKHDKILSLHIEWFGGEPFMFFKEVIVPISEYALTACEKADIPFYNTATTNGFLIKEELLSSLNILNFSRFHITLDGKRDLHNSVKYQDDANSAFDTTLSNINNLLNMKDDLQILLRINYTKHNLDADIIEQINSHVNENVRRRILILFRKVWQEKTDKDIQFNLYELMDGFQDAGYNVQRLNLINNFITCYVEKSHYNAINYDGTIVKCTAHDDLFSKNPPGVLQDNGQIVWRDNFEKDFHVNMNQRCVICKYLPICMGMCPRNYDKKDKTKFYCKMDSLDMSINKMLKNFIDNEYENSITRKSEFNVRF